MVTSQTYESISWSTDGLLESGFLCAALLNIYKMICVLSWAHGECVLNVLRLVELNNRNELNKIYSLVHNTQASKPGLREASQLGSSIN